MEALEAISYNHGILPHGIDADDTMAALDRVYSSLPQEDKVRVDRKSLAMWLKGYRYSHYLCGADALQIELQNWISRREYLKYVSVQLTIDGDGSLDQIIEILASHEKQERKTADKIKMAINSVEDERYREALRLWAIEGMIQDGVADQMMYCRS